MCVCVGGSFEETSSGGDATCSKFVAVKRLAWSTDYVARGFCSILDLGRDVEAIAKLTSSALGGVIVHGNLPSRT